MLQPKLDDFPHDVLGTIALSILTIAVVFVVLWSVLGGLAAVIGLAILAIWLMATLVGRSAPTPRGDTDR